MAPVRKNAGEVLQLRDGLEFEIVDGPNDWNLWLCFRGTIKEVSFITKEHFSVPPFTDPRQFIDGRICLLDNEPPRYPASPWKLRGLGYKGDTKFVFEASYDPQTRKGRLTVLEICRCLR